MMKVPLYCVTVGAQMSESGAAQVPAPPGIASPLRHLPPSVEPLPPPPWNDWM